MAGGRSHVYALELAAGHYATLTVDQRGIDVSLSLYAPGGSRLIFVDTPNKSHGPEPLHLLAHDGTLRLEILGNPEDESGHYALIVGEVRPAMASDRDRVASERAFAEAEALRRRQTSDSLRQAAAEYEQLLASFQSLGELGRRADVHDRLGRVFWYLGEAARSAEAYGRALTIFREQDRRSETAGALNGLGRALFLLGERRRVLDLHLEALEIHRSLGRRWGESISLGNLGRAYDALGRVDEALDSYGKALELQEQLGDQAGTGITLSQIGLLYTRLGERRRAREVLEEALPLLESRGDARRAAITLALLGRLYGESGRPREGVEYLLRALPVLRRTGARREVAVALNNLGWAYSELGQLEDARDACAGAYDVFRELGDRRSEAAALSSLGLLRARLGELDEAVELYGRALPLFASINDTDGETRTLAGLAYTHRLRDDLTASKATIERALERIETLRAEPDDPGLRAVFLATKQDYYRFYVDLLSELGKRHPEAGYEIHAFEAGERARARSLLDLTARAGAGQPDSADSAPDLGVPASLREIRERLLDEKTLLLAYTLGTHRSFAWAVTSDFFTCYELPGRRHVEQAARHAHTVLANSHRMLARAELEPALEELSRWVLWPVADQLAGRRLLVVPDGALHYVPFAALPLPRDAAGAQTGPLVTEHEVVTLPSASILVQLRRPHERPPAQAPLMVVADPVFDISDPRLARHLSGSGVPGNRQSRSGETTRFRRLPFSGDEARSILDLVRVAQPGAMPGAALGFEARRDILDELGRYRILHFATHGFFDPNHPERSGLALSQLDEEGRPQQGLLLAGEIHRLRLAADLVVLSACRTGIGEEIAGEGLVGLTQAFLAAGAQAVVVSLWQVQDRATAELMELFYREMLVDGRTPAAALRRAQVALWRRPGRQAPYYWAGFVVQGNG